MTLGAAIGAMDGLTEVEGTKGPGHLWCLTSFIANRLNSDWSIAAFGLILDLLRMVLYYTINIQKVLQNNYKYA